MTLMRASAIAVFVHHLPAITQQVGYNPANLEGQLPHSLASLILLSLPALLALGVHGVTHYLVRVAGHLQAHHDHASSAQPSQSPTISVKDTEGSAPSNDSSAALLVRGMQLL